jgi:hypothetical protein
VLPQHGDRALLAGRPTHADFFVGTDSGFVNCGLLRAIARRGARFGVGGATMRAHARAEIAETTVAVDPNTARVPT